MISELKQVIINDWKNYLLHRYEYINKFDAIREIVNIDKSMSTKDALRAWKLAYNKD
jgi:hypothetical protein